MNQPILNTTVSPVPRQVLPSSVLPSHYDLVFTPDIDKSVFDGLAIIRVTFNENTDSIVLNSNEIEIYNVALKLSNEETVYLKANDVTYDTKLTRATIILPKEIPSGSGGELELGFRGKINRLNGFYRTTYKDQDGNEKHLASTHFEANQARKAFPCWDEPNIKTTFDISLKVPKNLTALSNMNVVEEKDVDTELKLVKYATTPKMSTYLVAFLVGDLEYIERYSSNEVRCRVYTTRGLSKQGEFALDFGIKALDLFDTMFNIHYPLPKMDFVAIPEFGSKGMENWGLVFYHLRHLLLDDSGSTKTKQNIANTVAHELAHQWFGNLVTMEWWSDLWLNEGFATWAASYAITKIFPEWDYWTNFITNELQNALDLDSLRNSHPIEVEINDALKIGEFFDGISYNKGGSVVHMLYNYLGEVGFFNSISYYLKKHSYGNAKTLDLWMDIGSVTNQDITGFMSLWTKQVGYPYLEIKESGTKLSVEQKRFLLSGNVTSDEDKNLWWIPLGFVSGNSSKEMILTERSKVIESQGSFYKFNKDILGPYRVHYPKTAVERMVPNFFHGNIFTIRDRIGILSDIAALSQSGIGNATYFLNSIHLFKDEKNYHVLNLISSHINRMQSVWFEESDAVKDGFKSLNIKVFSSLVKELGWEFKPDDILSDNMLRTLAITNAGVNGDSDVIKEAQSRFDRYIKGDKSAVHPDLLAPVLQIVIINGDSNTFNWIKNEYLTTVSVELQISYLNAMGFVNSPELITKAMEFAISGQVKSQDLYYIFKALGDNPKSRRSLWEFIQLNFTTFSKSYQNQLGMILMETVGKLSSQSDYQSVEDFFQSKETDKYRGILLKVKESILANARWLDRGRISIESWMRSRQ